MDKFHSIEHVSCGARQLRLTVDGRPLAFDLATVSPVLATASQEQLDVFDVSPSGYGIHWPLLDEDIAIDGLLGVTHQPGPDRQQA